MRLIEARIREYSDDKVVDVLRSANRSLFRLTRESIDYPLTNLLGAFLGKTKLTSEEAARTDRAFKAVGRSSIVLRLQQRLKLEAELRGLDTRKASEGMTMEIRNYSL